MFYKMLLTSILFIASIENYALADFQNTLPEFNDNRDIIPPPFQHRAKVLSPAQKIPPHDIEAPIFFSGKYASVSKLTGVVSLVGNVLINQQDTILKSDKAQLFSEINTKKSLNLHNIKRVMASGAVSIYQKASLHSPAIKATGDETEFLISNKILILCGHAKVWRKQEYLHGDLIKIDLKSGEIEVKKPSGLFDPNMLLQSKNI